MRLTEKDVIQSIKKMGDSYAPLTINRLDEQVSFPEGYRVDAVIEFSIRDGLSFEAVVEIAAIATPENILKRARQFVDFFGKVKRPNLMPLIIAPFIGIKQAQILLEKGISWIDLCGNMRVSIPGKIFIEKTGKKNRFPDTTPIKKIFEGTSSLVSRALLLQMEGFESQFKLTDFINNRNAKITTGTVSRVLTSLEEELLVRREKNLIIASDSKKILENLSQGYAISIKRKIQKRYKFALENPQKFFMDLFNCNIAYLECGFFAAKTKGLAFTDTISIYVKSIDEIQKACNNNLLDLVADSEFGNLYIIETTEPSIWFNTKSQPKYPMVDDIQLYLELMNELPRGPTVAALLKEQILKTKQNG